MAIRSESKMIQGRRGRTRGTCDHVRQESQAFKVMRYHFNLYYLSGALPAHANRLQTSGPCAIAPEHIITSIVENFETSLANAQITGNPSIQVGKARSSGEEER